MTNYSENKMKHNPYWDYIGLKEISLINGHAVLELPIIHEVTQSRGNVHGGVIASMVDAAVGAALRSTLNIGEAGVTVELKLNYLRPANGNKLIAKGDIIKKGKSITVGKAVIENDKKDEVATGIVTYMLKNKT